MGLSPNKKPALSNYAQGGPKILFLARGTT